MRIGLVVLELYLHGCSSLKEKRRVVKSLRERARHRFNIAAAEIDHQDLHQRAALAFVSVANDEPPLHRLFDKIVQEAESMVPGGVSETVREIHG